MSYEQSLSVIGDLQEWVEDDLRELAVAVHSAVVMETPFRDGHAKYNWHVSIANPDSDVYQYAGAASRSAAESSAIQRAKSEVVAVNWEQPIWIQN